MQKLRVQSSPLNYIAMHPEDYDPGKSYILVLLLHGFGSNMHNIADLAPALSSTGYVYICPNGPLEVSLGPGMKGFAWMPLPGERTNQDAAFAEEAVLSLIEELKEKYIPVDNGILLGGFSQGAMLTYRIGLPRPHTFAGLIALSGFIDSREELKQRLPETKTQPVFISHGLNDGMIPVDLARKSRDFLQTHGYSPEYREYPMSHEVNQAVIDDIRLWLSKISLPQQ